MKPYRMQGNELTGSPYRGQGQALVEVGGCGYYSMIGVSSLLIEGSVLIVDGGECVYG